MVQYYVMIIQCSIYLLLIHHSITKGGAGLYRIKLLLVIRISVVMNAEKS